MGLGITVAENCFKFNKSALLLAADGLYDIEWVSGRG